MNAFDAFSLGALSLLRPWWLLALLPWIWVCWPRRSRFGADNPWQRVVDRHLLALLMPEAAGAGGRRPRLPIWLALTGLLLVLALAGPALPQAARGSYAREAATIVLFDLSPSMHAPDVRPSRVARARLKLIDWLRLGREGDTALIAYAGSAHIIVPLSRDAKTLLPLVQELGPELMPVAGSRPLEAVKLARELLARGGYQEGELLWITDGIDAADLPALQAELQDGRLRPHFLAVGTEAGAPVTTADGGMLRDKQGGIVLARLDTGPLETLASASGGQVLLLSSDDSDLAALATPQSEQFRQREQALSGQLRRDYGPWLLLPALLCLLLALRRGPVRQVIFRQQDSRRSTGPRSGSQPSTSRQALVGLPGTALLAGLLGAGLSGEAHADWRDWFRTPDQQGEARLKAGDAAGAVERYADPQRRAYAQARAGDYAGAAINFAGTDSAESHYNRANALALAGQIDDALLAYNEALKRNPQLNEARANRDAVQAFKKRQQEQQQQQQSSEQNQNQPGQNGQQQQGQQPGNGARSESEGQEAQQRQSQAGDSGGDQQPPSDNPRDDSGQSQTPQSGDQGQQPPKQGSDRAKGGNNDARNNPLWQQLPDDPGGLLRRKMQLELMRRQQLAPEDDPRW